jgi:hypothetical protein
MSVNPLFTFALLSIVTDAQFRAARCNRQPLSLREGDKQRKKNLAVTVRRTC